MQDHNAQSGNNRKTCEHYDVNKNNKFFYCMFHREGSDNTHRQLVNLT